MDAAEKEATRNEARITVVEDHIITINHELGSIIGTLGEIQWVVRLIAGAVLLATLKLLFFPA